MQRFSTFARIAVLLVTNLVLTATARADNFLLNPGAEQGKGDNPSVWSRAMIAADGMRMEAEHGRAQER